MATKHSTWVLVGLSIIAAGLLGFASQATGEMLNYKTFNHIKKMENMAIPDAEGHEIIFMMTEGVNIFDNGEMAWVKGVNICDVTKVAGTFEMYDTKTFPDGSIIVSHTKGTTQATPAGVTSASK